MPKLAVIGVDGASGTRYWFDVYGWGDVVPAASGVYIVGRRDPAKLDGYWSGGYGYDFLYVGETNDFAEVFHESDRANLLSLAPNCLCVCVDEDPSCRLTAIKDLVKSLPPHSVNLDQRTRSPTSNNDKPIWRHASMGLLWGSLIGAAVKVLDTVVFFVASDMPAMAFLLLAVVVFSIVSSRVPRAGAYIIWVVVVFGLYGYVNVPLFFSASFTAFTAAFAAMVTGGVLGSLPGMAVGGLIGVLRGRVISRAPDAQPESPWLPLTVVTLPAAAGIAVWAIYVWWNLTH
jgi:hypothetical protein